MEVVLARTAGQLVLCKGDFPRLTHIATIPVRSVRALETGQVRWFGGRRALLGISFDDGSSIALMTQLAHLDSVIGRFCAPIIEGMQS